VAQLGTKWMVWVKRKVLREEDPIWGGVAHEARTKRPGQKRRLYEGDAANKWKRKGGQSEKERPFVRRDRCEKKFRIGGLLILVLRTWRIAKQTQVNLPSRGRKKKGHMGEGAEKLGRRRIKRLRAITSARGGKMCLRDVFCSEASGQKGGLLVFGDK